jgi:phage baseplate assembly protein V
VRGVVGVIDDSGAVQTIGVTTHDGVVRSAVEVHQPYGYASMPPDQALTVLSAIGADQGDQVAWPLASTGYRFGNLLAGQSVMYDSTGARLLFDNAGNGEWKANALLHIQSLTVTIDVSNGLTVNGPLTVVGDLTVTGAVTITGDVNVTGNINATGTVNGRH